jgi:hypothetical protein
MALKKVSSSRDSRGILANASNACIGGLSVGADATANLDGSGNAVTVNGPIAGTVNNIANLNADPAWLCTRTDRRSGREVIRHAHGRHHGNAVKLGVRWEF